MADSFRLTNTAYRLGDTSQDRRQKRHLNPIIEDDSEDNHLQRSRNQQKMRCDTSHLKIEAWLSPMSDHFPTPRGVHYLAAPILPSSPSTVSVDGSSPTTFSNPWNRTSVMTDSTEFEDIYDVSDDEFAGLKRPRQSSSTKRHNEARMIFEPTGSQPTPLIIPPLRLDSCEAWSAVDELKKITSPVPLTPSVKLPMSPAQREFIGNHQSLEVPRVSAPPSLDGSLSSEQLATMSSPPTPVIGGENDAEEAWTGVHLQPGALATLHALSGEEGDEDPQAQPDRVLEVSQPAAMPEMQQQSLRLITSCLSQADQETIHSPIPKRQSLAGLTKLDIPSPGGFFSGLSPRSRNTWHLPTISPEALVPPTSTTAEQFYRCPWNSSSSLPRHHAQNDSVEDFYRSVNLRSTSPVEQVIEVPEVKELSEDVLTARLLVPVENEEEVASEIAKSPSSPFAEVEPTEIVVDYDPTYARKQQKDALSNLDRTELWLMAQRAYLKGVVEIAETNLLNTTGEIIEKEEEEENEKNAIAQEMNTEQQVDSTVLKKMVRFSDIITTSTPPKHLPSKLLRLESAYYRAFQEHIVRTQQRDVFVHQLSRFEALQAQRVALRTTHRNQLLGKYQLSVVPQSAKKRLSANVARGDDTLTDDPEKLRKEKEYEAMNQMTMSTWHVSATKFLNGGKLISAPVTKRLVRLSRMVPTKDGLTRDRARILDLGGQSTCDWAWHVALQYPNTKIYTVTTKAIRQLSNSNIRGPSNHRHVAVERLTKLPFADNQFDLISARELHSILKLVGENGEDEWETCLSECMRVLKPGGYLEFSLLDSDIMNAGPLGLAKSVEFGFALKTLGYDPNPTKMWMGRLARAGFEDTRRVWLCLPLGARLGPNKPPTPPKDDSAISQANVCQVDAMVMGSTHNIANVCSIVGGWSWERWLLRCEMENVAGELRLADTVTPGSAVREAGKCLEGVSAVMEEGRSCRAGFRMLNGYARKPKAATEIINVALEG